MYPLYYKGLRLSVTFQVKHLCVGDFASFAKIFAGFYFGKGIVVIDPLNITGNNRLNNQKNGLYVGTYNSTTKILFRS